mmetsp:Transcript_8009/g.23685  ORF Transcript_8009/g.23685 Transcript_8009/m.23685 type:complete len:283 (-) Transcript_8009:1532-2380(-)
MPLTTAGSAAAACCERGRMIAAPTADDVAAARTTGSSIGLLRGAVGALGVSSRTSPASALPTWLPLASTELPLSRVVASGCCSGAVFISTTTGGCDTACETPCAAGVVACDEPAGAGGAADAARGVSAERSMIDAADAAGSGAVERAESRVGEGMGSVRPGGLLPRRLPRVWPRPSLGEDRSSGCPCPCPCPCCCCLSAAPAMSRGAEAWPPPPREPRPPLRGSAARPSAPCSSDAASALFVQALGGGSAGATPATTAVASPSGRSTRLCCAAGSGAPEGLS